MSWMKLATYAAGAASLVASALLPVTAPYLVPAGVGLVMWATKHPSDKKKD